MWCLLAIYYDCEVPVPLIMKVQVYWFEITHYTSVVEIPFDDFDTQEAQDYICEMDLPFDNAKEVGFEIERDSVDAFEVE